MSLDKGNLIISGSWNSNTATILGDWYTNYIGNPTTTNTLNYGIQFGTDSLPQGYPEFASVMGGSIQGIDTTGNPPQIGNQGSIVSASILTSAFLTSINLWGSIRQTTFYYAVIGGTTTQVGSGVAYLSSSYQLSISNPSSPSAGQLITGSGGSVPGPSIESYFQALYNSYINNVRNNTASATITVCHSSCHSSCHGSRGRR